MAANPVELTTAETLPQFNVGEKYYVYIFRSGNAVSVQTAYILVYKTIFWTKYSAILPAACAGISDGAS
jgi:hypothetical protein